MRKKLKQILTCAFAATMVLGMTGCGSSDTTADTASTVDTGNLTNPSDMSAVTIDNTKWRYDEDNNVYYQIGVSYCAEPATTDYESMAIYVPGDYMTATDNGDGTYTCTVNEDAEVGKYTASTAPIVMPINTAGYSAQAAATSYSYSGLSDYLEAGYVYVYAGCRGRNNGDDYDGGAPWGVTDLKAAVRCLRYNADLLPGDMDSIFTFGHSGGGAQSSLMGATGDSSLYYEYLESIGAVMMDDDGNYISDAIAGAMCWCPITALDEADEAYEWMMGQYATSGTRADDTWTSALSDDLAEQFATYINALGLTDEDGNALTLESSDDGIYTAGTYYEYVKSTIETSLNNFLSDTAFPYTASGSTEMADGGFAGAGSSSDGASTGSAPSGDLPSGEAPSGEAPSGEAPSGEAPSGEAPSGEVPSGEVPSKDLPSGEAPSGDLPSGDAPSGKMPGNSSSSESVTYETSQDYIDSLNSDVEWISYDADTNTATITGVAAFVEHCKNASKDVCAFDDLNCSQAENAVFGNSDSDSLHFDSIIANLLSENADEYAQYSDYDDSYAAAYAEDMDNVDALGTLTQIRQNMYNPMYFISDYYEGVGTSTVAKYWRINTGIEQSDTSLTTEMNLYLALLADPDVESVDFTTVWGQGHTTAERTGDSTTNFINWVDECLGK